MKRLSPLPPSGNPRARRGTRPLLAWSVALLLAAGCGKPKDVEVGLVTPKQAAQQLDQVFTTAEPEVQNNMHAASAALRDGQYEKAVVALQGTRAAPNLTVDQGIAIHNSLVALEHNLINAAAAGDANAQRAYDLLKKSKRN